MNLVSSAKLLKIAACAFALLTVVPAILYGQATSGTILGTVTDTSGAPISGANVKITDQDHGTASHTVTNESGNYSRGELTPSNYNVEFEANGFQRVLQQRVVVTVDHSTRVDAQLNPGQVNTQVEVTAAPPALVTDRAEVSTTLSTMQTANLPLLNRNISSIQLLLPGAIYNPAQPASSEDPQQGIEVNTNGQDYGSANFMIDGTDNNIPVLGISAVNPTVDSVQEFKVTTGNFDAEFARAGGAVIEVATKSGTNNYHGSLFEFLQNNFFNARNPFTELNGTLPLRWNQFGGSFGGPIKKNKLFAFGDYQGMRQRNDGSLLTTVPTQAERNGNFSALGVPIYDPNTGNPDGSGRTRLPNAQIPTTEISTQAQNLLTLVPMPNFGAPGASNNNYIATGGATFNTNKFDLRVDDDVSDKLTYFARYSYSGFYQNDPPAYGAAAGGPALFGLNFAGNATGRLQNIATGMDYIFSPSLLTDVRFGFSRYLVNVLPLDYGTNADQTAGLPGLNLPGRPDTSGISAFTIPGNGGFNLGYSVAIDSCNCLLHERYQMFQGVDNWTKIVGNHSFKWGADIRRQQNIRVPDDNRRNGSFSFSPSVTGALGVSNSGLSVASFLFGLPSGFTRFAEQTTDPEDMQWSMSYFAQDTWRITNKLTMSYGLRWDTWFPDYSAHPGEGSRYNVVTNSILVAGVGLNSSSANVNTQWHNFSPRLAFAYELNNKTVVRTGFGRSYYQEVLGFTFNNIANTYPTLITQQISPVNSYTGIFSLAQGPPAVVFPQIPSNGILQLPNNVSVNYVPANLKYPYVDSWNFSLERLLAENTTLTVSYVGNVGRHQRLGVLNPRGIPLNQALPGPGPLNPRRQLYQEFGLTQSITDLSTGGTSSYEALQTKLNRRFSKGYSLLVTYTFSKTIDTSGGYELANYLNRGVADFDRTQVFTLGHVWQLPFGKGRTYLSNANRVIDALFGGWQFSGITSFDTGLPFSPTLSTTAVINSDIPLAVDRPNQILSVSPYSIPGGQSRNEWFNPAAYAIPAPYTYGTAGRNSLRGPNLFQADWSLDKQFAITEHKDLQFRWEVYNVLNRTNLANPNGAVDAGPGNAGAITGLFIGSTMRRMQLGLRLDF